VELQRLSGNGPCAAAPPEELQAKGGVFRWGPLLLTAFALGYAIVAGRLGVGMGRRAITKLQASAGAQLALSAVGAAALTAFGVRRCRRALLRRLHLAFPILLALCIVSNALLFVVTGRLRQVFQRRLPSFYARCSDKNRHLMVYLLIQHKLQGKTVVRYSDDVMNAFFLLRLGGVGEVRPGVNPPVLSAREQRRLLRHPHVILPYEERRHRHDYERMPGRPVKRVVFLDGSRDGRAGPDEVFHLVDAGRTYYVIPDRLMPGRAR